MENSNIEIVDAFHTARTKITLKSGWSAKLHSSAVELGRIFASREPISLVEDFLLLGEGNGIENIFLDGF